MSSYVYPDLDFPVKVIMPNPNPISAGIDPIVLEELYKNELTLLDFSREHVIGRNSWNATNAKQYFDQLGLTNIIYLTSNLAESSDRIIFFPGWIYNKNLSYKDLTCSDIKRRSIKISCLNRFPSAHRVYCFHELQKKKYSNEMMLSFYGLSDPYLPMNQGHDIYHSMYNNIPIAIKDEIAKLILYKESIPKDNIWYYQNLHSFDHPAYLDSYLNIVTESSHDQCFFSEKSCKPLAAGQLFLQVNAKNSVDTLRYLGFECFDQHLNNHSYENNDHFVDRINEMMSLIDNIYDNIEELYFLNKQEIIFNREYLTSDGFKLKLLKPLRQFGALIDK
jgi:hypothetical protein